MSNITLETCRQEDLLELGRGRDIINISIAMSPHLFENILGITCHENAQTIQACRQACRTLSVAQPLVDQNSCSTSSVSPFLVCTTHYSLSAEAMHLSLH